MRENRNHEQLGFYGLDKQPSVNYDERLLLKYKDEKKVSIIRYSRTKHFNISDYQLTSYIFAFENEPDEIKSLPSGWRCLIIAKKSKKRSVKPKRSRKPVKRKYDHNADVEDQRRTIPLILALANKILETIGFVDFINESVEWHDEQCQVTPGHLAKAVILAIFFDIRAPLYHIENRFIGIGLKIK